MLPSLQPHPSLRKLVSILGDDPRIDVPIKEIAAQGLTALLDSKLPLCYFLVYLLKEYSSEILFFTLDVQAFEQTLFPSTMSQNMAAQVIFNTYLAPSSLLEVNASHRARRQVIDGVQQGLRCCFASAQEETIELLDRAYEQFKKSSTWIAMEQDIGTSMIISPNRVETFKNVIHNTLSTHYLSNELVTLSTKRNVALREKVPALLLSRIGLSL
ncbi:RGS domain-containing protein [Chytridium lagenaria]|nr:RGS domain-containing protein [Chytridium lagenaria]